MIIYDDKFDPMTELGLFNKEQPYGSMPYQVFPRIFKDNRGVFCESITRSTRDWFIPNCYHYLDMIGNTVQVNRSTSKPGVIRGFHAQSAPYSQGKLVECLSDTPIWDIIIDARPNSKSFRELAIYKLSNETMNKVWVPRGFLHGFIVPRYASTRDDKNEIVYSEYTQDAHFQYFVDNFYSKDNEVAVNPVSVLEAIKEQLRSKDYGDDVYGLAKTIDESLIMSEKDMMAMPLSDFNPKSKWFNK